uniref:Uncharacterized protein At2g29880 family n=2 Tax=Cajanus cajan TaxID=3821 RepID=A0A151R4E4_CAJCA|nr:Uncharacterized protein At2g29880 family [Cajanus cajan]
MSNLMEKRERYQERKGNIWSVIKEIPNLDDRTRYMAVDLLDTNAKKDFFLMLSIKERSYWIKYKFEQYYFDVILIALDFSIFFYNLVVYEHMLNLSNYIVLVLFWLYLIEVFALYFGCV